MTKFQLMRRFFTFLTILCGCLHGSALGQLKIEIVSGDSQTVEFPIAGSALTASNALFSPLVVRVSDSGRPLNGAEIIFSGPPYRGLRFVFDDISTVTRSIRTDVNGLATLSGRIFPVGMLDRPPNDFVPQEFLANINAQIASAPSTEVHFLQRVISIRATCPSINQLPTALDATVVSISPARVKLSYRLLSPRLGDPIPKILDNATHFVAGGKLLNFAPLGGDVFEVIDALPLGLNNVVARTVLTNCQVAPAQSTAFSLSGQSQPVPADSRFLVVIVGVLLVGIGRRKLQAAA